MSSYRGVCWDMRRKNWRVEIRGVDGKYQHIGYFEDEVEAAYAFDAHAIVNNSNAILNFSNKRQDDVVAEAARGRAVKKLTPVAKKTSHFRGVSKASYGSSKWRVRIQVRRKCYFIVHYSV